MIIPKTHTPILITGTQRSGASIIAKIVQMAGAWTGYTTSMMENKKLKRMLERYYAEIQIDPTGQYPLPCTTNTTNIEKATWRGDIEESLTRQGYNGSRYWVFKNHRICQVWPLWAQAFPDAKYIIVRRKPTEVVNSCLKTAFMDAFQKKDLQEKIGVKSEYDGWVWWIRQHEEKQIEMLQAGLNCRIIWPDRMLDGNYSQIVEMLDWLRLKWHSGIVPQVERMLHKEIQK